MCCEQGKREGGSNKMAEMNAVDIYGIMYGSEYGFAHTVVSIVKCSS
jgi:hypothetical protein